MSESGFWNYRVIHCEAEGDQPELYQIHVVEYNENGQAVNWSETGEAPFGGSIEALKDDVKRLSSAFERPVLKVTRKDRKGYVLVEVNSGEEASAEPPK